MLHQTNVAVKVHHNRALIITNRVFSFLLLLSVVPVETIVFSLATHIMLFSLVSHHNFRKKSYLKFRFHCCSLQQFGFVKKI